MKDKKNLVWILLGLGLIYLAYKNKNKKKVDIIYEPYPGEFPLPGSDTFPSDVPDYQN